MNGTVGHDTSASRRRPRVPLAILILVISAVSIVTAVRIEILNVRAGSPLPRRESRDGESPKGLHHLMFTTEERWRAMFGPHEPRPLTDDERAQMETSIRRVISYNQLLDVVRSWGMLQYLLVPVGFLLSAEALLRSGSARLTRLIGAVGICIAVAAGVLIFYRDYFACLD